MLDEVTVTSWANTSWIRAFKAASRYKLAGGAAIVATAVIGGIETYNGYQMDGGQFGYNTQSAAVGVIPGAIIGGFVGGFAGSSLGSSAGQGAINLYHGR